MIAGQHAQAARVDRQRLMQRELRREIGDGVGVEAGIFFRPPAVARLARRIERRERALVESKNCELRDAASSFSAATTPSMRTGLCAVWRQSV
jgi:hypothetical protein